MASGQWSLTLQPPLEGHRGDSRAATTIMIEGHPDILRGLLHADVENREQTLHQRRGIKHCKSGFDLGARGSVPLPTTNNISGPL